MIKELANLQQIDYDKYAEAEKWMKSAKVMLDNFDKNKSNPNYIAFDLMIGANNNQQDNTLTDDLMLLDDGNKNNDIIDYGAVIAENISKN